MLALYLYVKNWLGSDEGQDLIEYGLIIAVMIIIAVLALAFLGTEVSALWGRIATWLSGYLVTT